MSVDCRWVGADDRRGDSEVKKIYRLVAVPREGGDPQILAQWAVLPGEDTTVEGSTNLAPGGIATIELKAVADDAVVLQSKPGHSSWS